MCKAEAWNEGYSSTVTWKELAWQLFFIRVITRVYTRTCTWFQLRLQFVLDLENKNSKNNKEKTSLNQIKTNKKVSSIQEKFRFFVLPVVQSAWHWCCEKTCRVVASMLCLRLFDHKSCAWVSQQNRIACPPIKWKLNRTTQLAPVSHPAVLLQGPGSFFRTNHVLQSRILS